MIRLVLGFLLLFVVASLAAIVVDTQGHVEILLGDYQITTPVYALVFAVLLLVLSAVGLVVLTGWLRREFPVYGSNRAIRRQRRGLDRLNRALVALAAGDEKLALRLVGEAELLLPPQPLVHLIAAESAARSGDMKAAEARYRALENSEDGRFLGLRGLLIHARQTGREAEALRLARRAFDENPKSPWVLTTVFALEVAAGHWTEAEAALDKVERQQLLDKSVVARHRGALFWAQASELALTGDIDGAAKLYKQALKVRPGFAPATAALAKLELDAGKRAKAEKLITAAWGETPHRAFERVWRHLDKAESKFDWLQRAEHLAGYNPNHPASLMLVAEAALDAKQYNIAAEKLQALSRYPAVRQGVSLELRFAREQGRDTKALETQLTAAPDGSRWVCGHCYHVPDAWAPLCEQCGHFDSYDWVTTGLQAVTVGHKNNDTVMLLSDVK